MITIDWIKQQVLNADPKPIQVLNFFANLDRAGQTAMYSIIEQVEENVLDFSQGTEGLL